MSECSSLITSYIDWLKNETHINKIGDYCEITTPFVDRNNDLIQIYIKKEADRIIITDDSNTIRDLRATGFILLPGKRQKLLNTILNGFGVKIDKDELFVETQSKNFPNKKHNLIQAILAVSDMYLLAKSNIDSLFKEDVEKYFLSNHIRFTSSLKLTGKGGFDHSIDFVIPASENKPERIIKALPKPSKQNIELAIFSWIDVKDGRDNNSTAFIFLNDEDQKIPSESLSGLKTYGINPILWSKREDFREELAA